MKRQINTLCGRVSRRSYSVLFNVLHLKIEREEN